MMKLWMLKRSCACHAVVLSGGGQLATENVHANLQIWDIGGQQLGSAMLDTYLAGSHAILLVYDITNFQSFRDLEDWLYFVKQTFSKAPKMPYVGLIGNKSEWYPLSTSTFVPP